MRASRGVYPGTVYSSGEEMQLKQYRVIFRDQHKHILAIETVDCMTVGVAATLASERIAANYPNGNKILADARHLTIDWVIE